MSFIIKRHKVSDIILFNPSIIDDATLSVLLIYAVVMRSYLLFYMTCVSTSRHHGNVVESHLNTASEHQSVLILLLA